MIHLQACFGYGLKDFSSIGRLTFPQNGQAIGVLLVKISSLQQKVDNSTMRAFIQIMKCKTPG